MCRRPIWGCVRDGQRAARESLDCRALGLKDGARHVTRRANKPGDGLAGWDVVVGSQLADGHDRELHAPLVATHSNAHAICPATRNLTDRQLDAIRDSEGLVGLNYNCGFLHPDGKNDSALDLGVMVDHLDYLIGRLGEDKVGFGSDFDGATMPEGIRDVSLQQNLIEAMRARGYDDALIRKIAYENWLRVLTKTWGE